MWACGPFVAQRQAQEAAKIEHAKNAGKVSHSHSLLLNHHITSPAGGHLAVQITRYVIPLIGETFHFLHCGPWNIESIYKYTQLYHSDIQCEKVAARLFYCVIFFSDSPTVVFTRSIKSPNHSMDRPQGSQGAIPCKTVLKTSCSQCDPLALRNATLHPRNECILAYRAVTFEREA